MNIIISQFDKYWKKKEEEEEEEEDRYCDLQRLALYWFQAPGLQLDNEVSQSTDQPHGTVCHQHYDHRTCRKAPSSGHLFSTARSH